MLPFVRAMPGGTAAWPGRFLRPFASWRAATFLFAAVRRIFQSTAAAAAATGLAALNPNLLYLQSTAMTEAVFFAALMALLYFTRALPRDAGMGSGGGRRRRPPAPAR